MITPRPTYCTPSYSCPLILNPFLDLFAAVQDTDPFLVNLVALQEFCGHLRRFCLTTPMRVMFPPRQLNILQLLSVPSLPLP